VEFQPFRGLPTYQTANIETNLETPPSELIGILGILLAVQIESFLWGLGTALGELPPYFVAKKVHISLDRLLRPGPNSNG
jgi:hypothetical protein